MATRFYLPSSGAPTPSLSPAFSADWEDTSIASRLRASTTRTGTAFATVAFTDADVTNRDILFRQYISDPINAVTITNPTIKFQIRGAETGDLMFTALAVRVIQPDGSLRGTILATTRDNVELAGEPATPPGAFVNRQFVATPTVTVVASDNDRIVIEIGTGGDPSAGESHSSHLRVGDPTTLGVVDLPENDTSVSDSRPWCELSTDIVIAPSFGWFMPPADVTRPKPQTREGLYVTDLIAPPPVVGRAMPARFGPEVIKMPPRIVSL